MAKKINSFFDGIILFLPIYYDDLNKITIANWFKILEGNKQYLYKIRLFKRIPVKFDEIIIDMMFQVDNMNMESINKNSDYVVLRSIATRTENKTLKFQADILAKEIENLHKLKNDNENLSLNKFIDYIEMTFDSIGKLDPDKLKAGRAFSLYNKAIEKNKRLEQLYKKH